jgi:hypothetical protein
MLKSALLVLAVVAIISVNAIEKKSNRVNLLSQAVGARMSNDQAQFIPQDSKFVPISRAAPAQMMNQDQFVFNGQSQGFTQPQQQFIPQQQQQQFIPQQQQQFAQFQTRPIETVTQSIELDQRFLVTPPTFRNDIDMNSQQQFNIFTKPTTTPAIFVQNDAFLNQQTFTQKQQTQFKPTQNQITVAPTMTTTPKSRLFNPQQQQPQIMLTTAAPKTVQRIDNKPILKQQPIVPQVDFCRSSQPGEIIAHPSNLNQFIICYGFGEFTIMDCPEHLVYNPHLVRCDLEVIPPVGCASNPCLNNGKCMDLPPFSFKCECQAGFAGPNCEKVDSCSSRPCGPEGQCVSMAPGSPVAHLCICQNSRAIGPSCQTNLEANPCVTPNSNFKVFPVRINQSVFIQCEGMRPHFKFCQFPLIFSPQKQACDWN